MNKADYPSLRLTASVTEAGVQLPDQGGPFCSMDLSYEGHYSGDGRDPAARNIGQDESRFSELPFAERGFPFNKPAV